MPICGGNVHFASRIHYILRFDHYLKWRQKHRPTTFEKLQILPYCLLFHSVAVEFNDSIMIFFFLRLSGQVLLRFLRNWLLSSVAF